jgi:hypothetical protein
MIEISEKPASIVALVIGLSCLLEYSLYKLLLAQTIQLIDASDESKHQSTPS